MYNLLNQLIMNWLFFRILNNEYDLVSYKATTDEVILESASLTEERKVKSEFFEDKAKSILSSVFHLANVSTIYLSSIQYSIL